MPCHSIWHCSHVPICYSSKFPYRKLLPKKTTGLSPKVVTCDYLWHFVRAGRPVLTVGLVTLHAQYNNVRCREPAVKLWQQAACVTGAHCYFGGSMCLSCNGSGFLACAELVHRTRPESAWWMVTPAAGVHPPMPFSQYIPQDLIYILSKEQRVLRCIFMGHNGSSMSTHTMSDFRVEKTTELNNVSPVLVCLFVSSDFCCRSVLWCDEDINLNLHTVKNI